MRKIFLIVLLTITISSFASNPLKIGVITDTHYLSEKLMDNGYAIQNYVYNNGKNVIVSPEVLDKVVADYMESDIEVLLVCGDLTKDGEKQSHIDFRDKLKPLHEKGVKIFVIPGNHDIYMPHATKYQGNKTFKTEDTSPKEFEEIYADYGFKESIFRNTGSLSYVSVLDDDTWLLAIDVARYQDYTEERAYSSGVMPKTTERWIEFVLDMAQKANKQVVAMMHWGVVEHIPMQAKFFPNYLVADHEHIASLLADAGVKVIFSGHFHSNDISKFESNNGNSIYDIETGSLISYPFAYRFVELSHTKMDIRTKNITSTPSYPNLAEESRQLMKRIATEKALPMIKEKASIFSFSEGHQIQLSEIAGELFLLHSYGDEVVSDSIRTAITDIFIEKGFPVDNELNKLEMDLPPLDNNVTIQFD